MGMEVPVQQNGSKVKRQSPGGVGANPPEAGQMKHIYFTLYCQSIG